MHFCLYYASLKTSNAKCQVVWSISIEFSDSFQAIGVQSYEIRKIDQFISTNWFINQRIQRWIDWQLKIMTSNSCVTQIWQQTPKRKYQKLWKYFWGILTHKKEMKKNRTTTRTTIRLFVCPFPLSSFKPPFRCYIDHHYMR